MKGPLLCTVAAVAALSLAAAPAAAALTYNFDVSQADFNATFNETTGFSTLWNGTTGVGGSGGLNTSNADNSFFDPSAFAPFTTAGQSVFVSVAFKARVTAPNTAGGEGLRIGLNIADNSAGGTQLASAGYLVAGIGGSGATTDSVLIAESRNNAPGTTSGTNDVNVLTLTDNAFYRLDATFTYTGANAFSVDTSLFSLGASGTDAPVLLDSYSATRTGLTSLAGVDVYTGVQAKSTGDFGGVRAVDNFTNQVPEPTSLAALGAAGLFGLGRRRRAV